MTGRSQILVRTWVVPNGFPEKIQPLLQAINISEYVIFYVASLDRYTGEQILALDMLKKKDGILSHSYEVDESRLNSMIKGTVLQNYKKGKLSRHQGGISKTSTNFKRWFCTDCY